MLSPGLLTLWTRQVMQAGRDQDDVLVDEITERIAAEGDVFDLLAVCRAAAYGAHQALLVLFGEPNAARGEAWSLDLADSVGDPVRMFTARLVTAYANRDHDHVTALVAAAAGASPHERAESLRSLISYAAELDARAAHHPHPMKGTEHDEH